jgi:hypothetical protein
MEGILAAFAQFDNDVRPGPDRASMRAALELGRWTFPASLGCVNAAKWSKTSLIHDPERGSLVRRAFEDLATGQHTKQEVIARYESGLRSRKGPAAIATERGPLRPPLATLPLALLGLVPERTPLLGSRVRDDAVGQATVVSLG